MAAVKRSQTLTCWKAPPPINGPALVMRLDVAPFNNIQVRQAIQMSIDLETIAKTYLGGMCRDTDGH